MFGSDVRCLRRILCPFLALSMLCYALLIAQVDKTSNPAFSAHQPASSTVPQLHQLASIQDKGENDTAPTPVDNNAVSFPKPHPHAGARFANGSLGYVADPAALRLGIKSFLRKQGETRENDNAYWNVLGSYERDFRNSTATGREILSSDYICAFGPGHGFELDGGYKLLTEKIKIYNKDGQGSTTQREARPVRILCAIYTYPRMHDLLRTIALSWGYKCDGFLAFSTETFPSLGLVDLLHEGDESYNNMWQKTRSIWSYIYDFYRNDYDFFHLGGDDLYMIVENFRHFLSRVQIRENTETAPLFLGEWYPDGTPNDNGTTSYMVTGRPGYTLNRAALELMVTRGFPKCLVHAKVSYEDRAIARCFRDLGILGGDTRDEETGEQQYHGVGPNTLFVERSKTGKRAGYYSKAAAYWETLEHPSKRSTRVGPKHELEAAATYSVSLHDLFHPLYVARIHALLYKKTCPADSTLGKALRIHGIVD